MSKVYSLLVFESNIHKEMVVKYLLDGEEAGDLPDIAMWSYHSIRNLALEVEKMEDLYLEAIDSAKERTL